jgi:hypothetical protein
VRFLNLGTVTSDAATNDVNVCIHPKKTTACCVCTSSSLLALANASLLTNWCTGTT